MDGGEVLDVLNRPGTKSSKRATDGELPATTVDLSSAPQGLYTTLGMLPDINVLNMIMQVVVSEVDRFGPLVALQAGSRCLRLSLQVQHQITPNELQ